MEMIIITGMSGAGKSRVIDTLEDIGYYCVDNMPVKLLLKFVEIAIQSDGSISKMAVVVDSRNGKMFSEFAKELDWFDENNIDYRLLYLDCSDSVLMRRFKETRRKHPLTTDKNSSVEAAINKEKSWLSDIKLRSDYIIDTTHLSTIQLKERISAIFLSNVRAGMLINCMSFGFKHGYPAEADLVFDVRCLPNPFYIQELKGKTGVMHEVSDYVMSFESAVNLYEKIKDLVDYTIPLYIQEGKTQLVIAFGCTGGKHRSVTFAEKLLKHLTEENRKVTVNHRDILK